MLVPARLAGWRGGEPTAAALGLPRPQGPTRLPASGTCGPEADAPGHRRSRVVDSLPLSCRRDAQAPGAQVQVGAGAHLAQALPEALREGGAVQIGELGTRCDGPGCRHSSQD